MAFCVGDRHFVTCVHVISQALSPKYDQFANAAPSRDQKIKLRFVEAGSKFAVVHSHVVLWSRCISNDETASTLERRRSDVALLELDDEALNELKKPHITVNLRPAVLLGQDELRYGRMFHVFGSSNGGLFSEATLKIEAAGRWLAIHAQGAPIQHGFSGGAATVIDGIERGVLGMVVRAQLDERQAVIIPAPVLHEILSDKIRLPAIETQNDRIRTLILLLEQLSSHDLQAALFRTSLADLNLYNETPTRAHEFVKLLDDLPPSQSGQSPLLAFVSELVRQLPELQLRNALTAWLAKVGMTVPPMVSTAASAANAAYGVIEICRGPPSGFVTRAWLCATDNISLGTAEPLSRSALERWVSQIVFKFAERCQNPRRELILEFLLQDELLVGLEAQIERFRLEPTRRNSQILGTVYPLIFRSYWRAVDKMAMHFRSNWQKWSKLANTRGCEPIYWITTPQQTNNLFAHLADLIGRAKNPQDITDAPMSVALAFPPKSGKGLGVLHNVLQAGAPVVLWLRYQPDVTVPEDLKEELSRVISGDFYNLPQRVLHHRLELEDGRIAAKQNGPWQFSVIYDDEERSLEGLVRSSPLRSDMLIGGQNGP